MIGDYFGYGVSALTAVAAVAFGIKQSGSSDRNELTKRVDALDKKVQMLQRREIWHERKEGILTDTLRDHGIQVPEMPPAPEVYES
ncbi:hypothetical protein [Nocardioides kribbensis]|uniref:hypothetical protein n=1 Tax=Nocardioides kribbensis TaxID=305517 RepID=UPI0032D9C5A9